MSQAAGSHLTCRRLASLAPSAAQPAASTGGSGGSSGLQGRAAALPLLLLRERGSGGMVQPRPGCNNALVRPKHAIAGLSRERGYSGCSRC